MVTCIIYPSGSVDVQVACDNSPFRLESEDDVSNLIAFLGEVKAFVVGGPSDPRSRIIPNVRDWTLTECDINKDVIVSDAFSLISLHTQGNFRVKDYEFVLKDVLQTVRVQDGIEDGSKFSSTNTNWPDIDSLFGSSNYLSENE